jgi:catechol 2,3-dioxygenase-like lactoylglutathione lyase family enzyme
MAISNPITGLHHVTAIAGDPQQNLDFYTGVLGLRLVKLTVNFDDPETYHLYYGNESGDPGTILTFFPWPAAPAGRLGTGQVTVISFAITAGSVGRWLDKLKSSRIAHEGPLDRFDSEVIAFQDPDGIPLELVTVAGDGMPEDAVAGFYGVTLSEEGYERTAALFTDRFGFRQVEESGNRFRYSAPAGGVGSVADVLCLPDGRKGVTAVGTVHHVAWRVPDQESQRAWRARLAKAGFNVTPVIDRQYFHSVYFREPGGVLFELATDPPGFAIDEPPEKLGTRLMLPAWLEPSRSRLEQRLPRLRLPEAR